MQGNKGNKKKTLKALLVVLLSKIIAYSKTTGKKLKSQIYLEKLDERIQGITFEEPQTTCDQENYDESVEIAAESVDGDVVNAGVESEISCLKKIVFRGIRPLRLDKFVLMHIEYLDQKVRLAAAKSKELNKRKTKSTRNQSRLIAIATSNKVAKKEYFEDSQLTLSQSLSVHENPDVITPNNNSLEISQTFSPLSQLLHEHHIRQEHQSKEQLDSENISVEKLECINNSHIKSSTPTSILINEAYDIMMLQNPEFDDQRDSLNENENWKGKGNHKRDSSRIITTRKRKRKYLSPDPHWNSQNRVTSIGIPLFENGSVCEPVNLGNKYVILQESCGIDSLLQVVTNGIAPYESYNDTTLRI